VNEPNVKNELLAEMDKQWANVERLCASMTEAEKIASRDNGEWSVKDIIAHLSAWEKYLLDRLGFVMTGLPPHYPVMTSWDDVHRFNAQVYSENKDRPLSSVMIEFRNLYHAVVTVIEALSAEQLNQPYDYDFPDDHITLHQLIRANTFEHYQEHCPPES
jgi:hypothetical protein